MTDIKLLELAAKGAGYKCAWSESRGGFYFGLGSYTPEFWNPLADDGHAFRLAVKLKLTIMYGSLGVVQVSADGSGEECAAYALEELGTDNATAAKATRRAIVRAAADIGVAIR